MKKRWMALLLAILTMCIFLACGEQTPAEDPPKNEEGTAAKTPTYGVFYTDENGRRQNDLIRIEIASESLGAPVTEIPYKIHSGSAYQMDVRNIYTDVEVKKDGEWVKASTNDSDPRIHLDVWAYNSVTVMGRKMKLGEKCEYRALDAGEYRLIVTVFLWVDGKEISIKPTVEFTVATSVA
jgi:hypothetical protein